MTTISSTQKLVPLIEDLSHSISEIASILKADAQETLATEAAASSPKREKKSSKQSHQEQEVPTGAQVEHAEGVSGEKSSTDPEYTKEQVKEFLLTKNLDLVLCQEKVQVKNNLFR